MNKYNTLGGYCQGQVHENRYTTATGQRKSSAIMDATPVAMTRRSSEGPSIITSCLHRDICGFRLSVASALLCSLIRFVSFLPSAPVLSGLCISRSASRLLSPHDSYSSLPLSLDSIPLHLKHGTTTLRFLSEHLLQLAPGGSDLLAGQPVGAVMPGCCWACCCWVWSLSLHSHMAVSDLLDKRMEPSRLHLPLRET